MTHTLHSKTLSISFPYTDKTVGKRGALPTELSELLENEGMFSRYRLVNKRLLIEVHANCFML